MRLVFSIATVLLSTAAAVASGSIYYGSRAGMLVDVVSMSGLDTAHAVIRTRHTRANAIAFCRDYVQKVTPQCIRDELATRLNDEITANFLTGEFVNFYGRRYRYAGPSRNKDSMTKYRIVDVQTGQEADGSSASGYGVNAGIFKALCPTHAPADPDFQ